MSLFVHHAAVRNPSYVLQNRDLLLVKIHPRTPSADDDDEESLPTEIVEPVAGDYHEMGMSSEESQNSCLFPAIFRLSCEA
ncbi:hypothetical protein TIFTF001_022320 [Ficus carica]|uniref:Uncharacterized protein n=1 Tax=Ficus carica TaxID=3494 RepID=A0AA88DEF0_FICCA|nr:hypothetical protein TIFTF001_022320 [Ficus carica]